MFVGLVQPGCDIMPDEAGVFRDAGQVLTRECERAGIRFVKVDAFDARAMRGGPEREISPAGSQIGDRAVQALRQMGGEQKGTGVDVLRAEYASLGETGGAFHRFHRAGLPPALDERKIPGW